MLLQGYENILILIQKSFLYFPLILKLWKSELNQINKYFIEPFKKILLKHAKDVYNFFFN